MKVNKGQLESLYERYNRREFVHPDPLEFLYNYPKVEDREIAGLIASSLAYGRVGQIIKSVAKILSPMGTHPSKFILNNTQECFEDNFLNFKHRFTTGSEIVRVLLGIQRTIEKYGSLYGCFVEGLRDEDDTIYNAGRIFSQKLLSASGLKKCTMIAKPDGKSACKRLNLYFRWMVRTDAVDPGGWDGISAAKLLVPVDTHMHRIGRRFGLTCRKQADACTVQEITAGFRKFVPYDAVKYDFALTRLGIHNIKFEDICLI